MNGKGDHEVDSGVWVWVYTKGEWERKAWGEVLPEGVSEHKELSVGAAYTVYTPDDKPFPMLIETWDIQYDPTGNDWSDNSDTAMVVIPDGLSYWLFMKEFGHVLEMAARALILEEEFYAAYDRREKARIKVRRSNG